MTELRSEEPILEPDLPIVDAHHHLWMVPRAGIEYLEKRTDCVSRALLPIFMQHGRYLLDEFMADVNAGHNIRASVFVDAHAMYRSYGTESWKSLGEVEFANGIAAIGASGVFGDVRFCAGIVGNVDLTLGDDVEHVLRAHLQAGGGRYRGVRANGLHDEDSDILGPGTIPGQYLDPRFRAGFGWLRRLGLSFDALLLEPQLPDLIDLARAFPDTSIILNHAGCPVGIGRYSGERHLRFPTWRKHMLELSRSQNVSVKIGGFGVPFPGFASNQAVPRASSSQLADEWRPYIETCVEMFGAERCMFESDFPIDSAAGSYAVIWNAFKRVTAGVSSEERTKLFSATAARVYRLEI